MRSYKHWTPRYVADRIATVAYEFTNPDHPWLTRCANEILNSYLTKADVGLEFGSGRSTIWFAHRLRSLTSVEHDPIWAARVKRLLHEGRIENVQFRLVPEHDLDETNESLYVKQINDFSPQSLDLVLVDGIYRDACALRALDSVRPGGVLVIDNANWYLPSNSRSPGSRNAAQGALGPIWSQVERRLKSWRCIWTSSGVTDTAIFICPA